MANKRVKLDPNPYPNKGFKKNYNPYHRSKQFAANLHQHARVNLKTGAVGEKLSQTSASYEMGYLSCRSDEAALFRKDHPDYQRKTKIVA